MSREYLSDGWEIAATAPSTMAAPTDAAFQTLDWLPSGSIGTVAAMLRTKGLWSFTTPRRFDGEDWWYRLRFEAPPAMSAADATVLGFDGLATMADVWLNGTHLLFSDNMFVSHEIPARGLQPGGNELILRFHALDTQLKVRRPRPRWRAPLVENQQLRWFRTTLLGRLPGWSPPVAAVGPWRPIWIETHDRVRLDAPRIRSSVRRDSGSLQVSCRIRTAAGVTISRVNLRLTRGETTHTTLMHRGSDGDRFDAELAVESVALWWPHTHGEPALYDVQVTVQLSDPDLPAVAIDLGRVGFRTISLDLSSGDFSLILNGERIFCRGACWTPPDVVSLVTDRAAAEAAIDQLAAAGMNMVRVGGTMVYESDAFLDACDAKGVLLWQDFMFANMDYPEGDAKFDASVTSECRQLLERLSARPCVALLCGNSEGAQQAAMWGAPRERWSHGLFEHLLPQIVAELTPQLPYWPSSAYGGAFPHQGNVGTTSYYGVGAYLRPLTDARRAEIRFASECLGLANVPEEEMLDALGTPGTIKVHSPLWKARVPRDLGAGWDFDDVRDHYLREIFGIDALAIRYADHDRYLQLSRAVSAEVMSAAFREWRRGRSTCNGALIWFLRDLWPGAGWGIVDASGAPKSAYYSLKRLLQSRAVFLSDEGGNGVFAHVANETALALDATLEVLLIPTRSARVIRKLLPIEVAARETVELPIATALEGFEDLSYAYRFGPPQYEAVMVSLLDATGGRLAHDFYFPLGHGAMSHNDLGLDATAQQQPDGNAMLEVTAEKLARFVTVRVPGYRADDQYFHLAPATPHRVHLRRLDGRAEPSGEVAALNGSARKIVFTR